MPWTTDNTQGYTEDQLDEINTWIAKRLSEFDTTHDLDLDDGLREQYEKSLSDAVANQWPVFPPTRV